MTRLLCFFLFTLCAAVSAAEPTVSPRVSERLKRLETEISGIKTLQATFVQEKQMAILQQTLVLKGRITLQQPDKLAWRVSSPILYGMVIDGSTLRQWSPDTGEVQHFSLNGNPMFATAVKQLQSWFSGNYLALTSEFDINILTESPLVLRFTPRSSSPVREIIARITIYFGTDERFLKSMELEETGGDKMCLKFQNVILNPTLTKEEWDPRHE